jgi:hypothetical protein
MLGGVGVQQGAYLIVGGDFMHPEQRPGVVFPVRLFQGALVFQERGALHEEHREGAQPRVGHFVGLVLTRPRIGERIESAANLPGDVVKGQCQGAKRYAHSGVWSC